MASTHTATPDHQQTALLRVWQITGDSKRGIEPMLPIGRSTFLERVRKGIYPKPVKIGSKTTAWKKSDILELMASFEGGV